jgi:hypothetical protein
VRARSQHGGAFVGYWGGLWVGMYVVLWASMENAGIDAVQWIHKAGLDTMVGIDMDGWSPSLINGLVAIEVNYLLEFARLPVVLFLLKKRNSGPKTFGGGGGGGGGGGDGDGGGGGGDGGGVFEKRHSNDLGDKFKP